MLSTGSQPATTAPRAAAPANNRTVPPATTPSADAPTPLIALGGSNARTNTAPSSRPARTSAPSAGRSPTTARAAGAGSALPNSRSTERAERRRQPDRRVGGGHVPPALDGADERAAHVGPARQLLLRQARGGARRSDPLGDVLRAHARILRKRQDPGAQ